MHVLLALLLLAVPAQGWARHVSQEERTAAASVQFAVDPEAVVRESFADHFTPDMGFTPGSVARKGQRLTPDLLQQIDAYFSRPMPADDPPAINGDPFTNTQGYLSTYTVRDVVQGSGKAEVPVVIAIDAERRRSASGSCVRRRVGWPTI